jgi:hypothetical protein
MRRSLPPLHWSTPEPAPAQPCSSPSTFDRLSAAGSFDSSSLSSCRIFSDAPSVRGYVDSQSGKQGSKDLSSVSSATLTKERHYASKPFPHCALRLTPQNIGVDVEGRPNLGLACLQFHREPVVSGLHLRTPAGSTNAHQGVRL